MSNIILRHHPVTIALHWITFFTILAAVGAVISRELVEDSQLRLLLLNIHKSLGVLIFLIVIVRIFCRYRFYLSHITHHLPSLLRRSSNATHLAVYCFLLTIPVTGLLLSNAAGKPLIFLGLIKVPSLIAKNRELAEQLSEIHETLAWVLIAIVFLHICAALWHHYIRKDHVLISIFPKYFFKNK